MKTKTKLLIGIGVIVSVLGVLIYVGVKDTAAFYMTVDEVETKKSDAVDKPLKMSGKIVGDTVQWDPQKVVLKFELQGENGTRIPVQYAGVKPDTFNDGWEAIVEGRLDKNGLFTASNLLVKCPSKYEAMQDSGAKPPAGYSPPNTKTN